MNTLKYWYYSKKQKTFAFFLDSRLLMIHISQV